MNFIKKIADDTLKNQNGNYSAKRLTMGVSFATSIIMGYIILFIYPEHAMGVFFGFLGIATGMSIIGLYGKIRGKQIDHEINEPKTEMP